MIHRWETCLEDVQLELSITSDRNGRPNFSINCTSGIHLNLTSVLLRLITHPSLQMDVVTGADTVLQPYLICNNTGMTCDIYHGTNIHLGLQGSSVSNSTSSKQEPEDGVTQDGTSHILRNEIGLGNSKRTELHQSTFHDEENILTIEFYKGNVRYITNGKYSSEGARMEHCS